MYPSIKFFALVTLKLKLLFRPSKHKALKQIAISKAKNFIDGYTSIRKLTDEELKNIKVLSQGAALRFLLTRVFDALNKVEGAIVKIKDPMEYLKRLEFHKNSKDHEDYFF